MTKHISIGKTGKFALVDDEDYDLIMQWKWWNKEGYAIRETEINKHGERRKRKRFYMHRLINKTPDGMEVDHINGDKLDNRKENLRTCTRHQNIINRCSFKGASSKFKGVLWNVKLNKWRARIRLNKKDFHLGYFVHEKDAARAYNDAAIIYHGDFARLNQISD